jgi:hypothetical protein
MQIIGIVARTVEASTGRAYEVVMVAAGEDAKFMRPLPEGGFLHYNLVKRYI